MSLERSLEMCLDGVAVDTTSGLDTTPGLEGLTPLERRRQECYKTTLHLVTIMDILSGYRDTAANWLQKLPDHKYMQQLRENMDNFVMKVSIDISRVETLHPARSADDEIEVFERRLAEEVRAFNKELPEIKKEWARMKEVVSNMNLDVYPKEHTDTDESQTESPALKRSRVD